MIRHPDFALMLGLKEINDFDGALKGSRPRRDATEPLPSGFSGYFMGSLLERFLYKLEDNHVEESFYY
jgi:hypothetical protein